MNPHRVLAALIVVVFTTPHAWSQTFIPTSGIQPWNDGAKWSGGTFPNLSGLSAILPVPTGDLTVNLGEPIIIGSLTINKSTATNPAFNVTVGEGTRTLTFDGGTTSVANGGSGTSGQTTIAAPVAFTSTFTVAQKDPQTLQFTNSLSGSGSSGLTINRVGTGTDGSGTVVLGAANSYTGTTTLFSPNTNTDYLLVRLNNANSIPGGLGFTGGTSNLTVTGSVIMGLGASDFNRAIGTGADKFQFTGQGNSGWAAFGQDRAVNFFGDGRRVIWGSAVGTDPPLGLNLGTLVLGHTTADKTIDFQNMLDLNTVASPNNRNIRVLDGSAAIDARISGQIIVGAGTGILTFQGGGTLSLTAANNYGPYTTAISNSTTVVLDNASALPSTNLSMAGNSILGLGTGVTSLFTRALGNSTNQIQFTAGGGFAAFGGNKSVNLGGTGATIKWGLAGNFFVPSGSNLTLSALAASGTLDFQNPIDVNSGAARTIDVGDGSAAIDAVLSGGVIDSGSGGSIRKNGDGTLQLITVQTYTGQTIVAGGSLRLDIAGALPSASQLNLQNGGVIGLGIGNDEFTRTLGSSAGQVSTSGTGGGFAAYGGTKVVRLNNDANFTPVWGSGSFLATKLVLSDGGADATVDFVNPIDLGVTSTTRTIEVRGGSAVIDAKLSGVLSGAGANGITKTNPGTLELSAANTYAGATTINAGVLLLTNASSIPGGILFGSTGGNINFTGANANNIAVLGLGQGDFTRALGAGTGQVDLGTNAAFAAFYANRVVNLGGSSAQVTWASGNFVSGVLRLGDVGADATVDFQNPINLNGARTVSAANGLATVMGTLSGLISGTGSSLTKTGGGTLAVTAANTYDGGTTISQGRLLVNNTTGSGVGSGDVAVTAGTLGGSGLVGTAGDASNVTVSGTSHVAPGSSAGALTVFGDVNFSASTTFFDVEIGGVTSGTDYDTLSVNGTATLSGTLNVTLLNSFNPSPGNSFTILTATNPITTSFTTVNLPTLTGATWDTPQYNANSVVLSVSAVSLPGDYNGDGRVDAADYVAWRMGASPNPNTIGDYNTWRLHFGESNIGSAAGGNLAGNAVPEPATLVLLCLSIPLVASRRIRLDLV